MKTTTKILLLFFVVVLFAITPWLSGFLGTTIGTHNMEKETLPNIEQAENYAEFFQLELFYYPNSNKMPESTQKYFNHGFFFRITDDTTKMTRTVQNYIWYTNHEELSSEEYEAIVAFLVKENCDAEHYFTEMEIGILPQKILELMSLFSEESKDYILQNYQSLANIKRNFGDI